MPRDRQVGKPLRHSRRCLPEDRDHEDGGKH
jgi:hypothetical protein